MSYSANPPASNGRDCDALVYGWKGINGLPSAALQVRCGSSCLNDPSSAPPVRAIALLSGATSEIVATHSVSRAVDVANNVKSIGPASTVAEVKGGVVYVSDGIPDIGTVLHGSGNPRKLKTSAP